MLFDLVNEKSDWSGGNFVTVVFGGECRYEWNDTCCGTRNFLLSEGKKNMFWTVVEEDRLSGCWCSILPTNNFTYILIHFHLIDL